MISNLNAIARVDESLNQLMKTVALGSASPQQIVTFQGYIKRAREMGPQPHHAYLFAPLKRKELKIKEKKPKKIIPRDQKLTAFQERYLNDATILFEYVENANVRYKIPQDAVCEVLEPQFTPKDDDLEQDVKDVLISFLWIHNQKEVNEYQRKLNEYNAKKEEERKKEEDAKKEEERKKEEKEKEEEKKDDETNNDGENGVKPDDTTAEKTEETESNAGVQEANPEEEKEENVEVKEEEPKEPTRRLPPRKSARKQKKRPPPRKAAPKKMELPVEPEIKFTAMSFTVHGIPTRFIPIMVNSFKPLEQVQERMQHIMQNGSRQPNFYLWYQVDGKLDEGLAEDIRGQLNQEEKKMQGVDAAASEKASQAAKKRKLKEKQESKAKKLKEIEGNSIQSQPPFQTQPQIHSQPQAPQHQSQLQPQPPLLKVEPTTSL